MLSFTLDLVVGSAVDFNLGMDAEMDSAMYPVVDLRADVVEDLVVHFSGGFGGGFSIGFGMACRAGSAYVSGHDMIVKLRAASTEEFFSCICTIFGT